MTMPKFAANEADATLAEIDAHAASIKANFQSWGMPKEAAKKLVNFLDRMADNVEIAAFGEESFRARQLEVVTASRQPRTAEVIQREPDEKYMQTFANPMAPVQVESDEPYMKAYRDDQSSAVNHGKSMTGRPLAP